MDVVSFETAKRLKEAGFPQPDPDRGQLWYRNGTSLVYAPCVVDLLRHLPGLPVVYDGNGIFAVSGDFTGDESLPELLAKCWLEK